LVIDLLICPLLTATLFRSLSWLWQLGANHVK
jgi:hypothetical protein